MRLLRKRHISLISTLIILMSLIVTPSSAFANENIIEDNDDVNVISPDVALWYATFFVEDMINNEDVQWNSNTEIKDIHKMFDQNDNISAYAVDLCEENDSAGYIIVGAEENLINPILEYSDTMESKYEEFDPSGKEKIIYLGGLDYYLDNGSESVQSIEGEFIQKKELSNSLTTLPCKQVNFGNEHSINASYISDPFTYAKNTYGGTFTAVKWKNTYGPYCKFLISTQMPGYKQNCTPIAIANTLLMYQGFAGKAVDNASYAHNTIADYGISKGYYSSTGSKCAYLKQYIKESLNLFGYKSDVVKETASFGNIMYEIDSNHPLILDLEKASWNPYQHHTVVGYAYTRLQNENGWYKSFLKIQDGVHSDGYYLDAANLQNSSQVTAYAVRFK